MISDEFIAWQLEAMKTIYTPLIKKFEDKGVNISLAQLMIESLTQEYEAIVLKVREQRYPFEGICPKDKLEIRKNTFEPYYAYDQFNDYSQKIIREYYNMIKYQIRYPKRLGYMLGEIELQNDSCVFSAYTGCYKDNVLQSHVLEFELYKVYKKIYKKKWKKNRLMKLNKEKLLSQLVLRNILHKKFGNGKEENILISGQHRNSLLGVQMMVLVKNVNGSYDALRIRRSTDVAAKPGYLQFIPSGGLEAMNDCYDFDSQWDNYSITKALFRELLEECFGIDEDDNRFSSNNISPDRLYYNVYVKELLKMIDNQTAKMEFLGSTMSLVGLRHELSFLLVIENPNFAAQLTSNYESKSAIHLVDIRLLEKESFWKHELRTADDLKLLNCTSAGLFQLVRESELYKEALKKAYRQ